MLKQNYKLEKSFMKSNQLLILGSQQGVNARPLVLVLQCILHIRTFCAFVEFLRIYCEDIRAENGLLQSGKKSAQFNHPKYTIYPGIRNSLCLKKPKN